MKSPDRLKEWFTQSLEPGGYVDLDGFTLIVDKEDTNITPTLRTGVWEPKSSERLKGLLKKGDVFVDCGAHWGYYSLFASDLVGVDGLVYSFEPLYSNFIGLCLNVAINHRSNIRVLPFGLWHSSTILPLISERNIGRTGGSHIYRMGDNPTAVRPTLVTTLDSLFPPGSVDFLKVDCEGSDTNILIGATNLLMKGSPKLMVENPPVEFLKALGYEQTARFEDEQTWFFEKVR